MLNQGYRRSQKGANGDCSSYLPYVIWVQTGASQVGFNLLKKFILVRKEKVNIIIYFSLSKSNSTLKLRFEKF